MQVKPSGKMIGKAASVGELKCEINRRLTKNIDFLDERGQNHAGRTKRKKYS